MPEPITPPIATWNPARGVWLDPTTYLCGHSAPYSVTLPTSGMTRRGGLFPLPTSAPRTAGPACSSSPGPLLPTPEAKLAGAGPDYARANRQGSGGDDLTTVLSRLLPTPTATDAKSSSGRNPAWGHGTTLTDAADALLPTPRATDGSNGGPHQRGSSGDLMLPSAVHLLPTPSVADANGHHNRSGDRSTELLLPGVARALSTGGDRTGGPSPDGQLF